MLLFSVVLALPAVAVAETPPPPLIDAGGGADTCAAVDGVVRCWGVSFGATPVRIGGIPAYDGTAATRITSLSSSDGAGCVTQGGAVRCWGPPPFSWYANPDMTQTTAAVVPGFGEARSIAIGGVIGPLCGIDEDRRLRCMGSDNRAGQLGNGTTTRSLTPQVVPGLTDVTAVGAGTVHACAIHDGGKVSCWGANQWQQLGIPRQWDSAAYTLPQPLPIDDAETLEAGIESSCVIRRSGAVACWGASGYSEFLGGPVSGGVLAAVSGVSDASAVTAGEAAHCAIVSGRVRCWGRNDQGQIGSGEVQERGGAPVTDVPGLSGVRAITAGLLHTCAITDGDVWCWGWNHFRQLGDPGFTAENSPVPRRVPGSADWLPDGIIRTGGPLTDLSASRDLGCGRKVDFQDEPLFAYNRAGCGTWLAAGGDLWGPDPDTMVSGWPDEARPYRQVDQQERGSGTAEDPYEIATTVRAGALLVTQVDRYVDGQFRTTTAVTVRNTGTERVSGQLYNAGDCVHESRSVGDTWRWGYAFRTPVDERAGGVRCGQTNLGGRWTAWWPLTNGNGWTAEPIGGLAATISSGVGLQGRVRTGFYQHAAGLSWPLLLEPGETRTYEFQIGFGGRSDPDERPPAGGDTDRDGDGIRDAWERPGAVVDTDGDGRAELNLSAMGAGPDKADVFVQIGASTFDCEKLGRCASNDVAGSIWAPSAEAVRKVQRQFLKRGIRLHVDGGPQFVMNPETGEQWGTRSAIGPPVRAELLGLPESREQLLDTRPLEALRPVLFPASDRRGVFHGAVTVASMRARGAGGIAELPGSWSILGISALDKDGARQRLQPLGEAATFMHELGHNLGLQHGGDDELNHKPNYPSVMNYLYSAFGVPAAAMPRYTEASLTYSDGELNTIDERALSELDPLRPEPLASRLLINWRCPETGRRHGLVLATAWHDWNCDEVSQYLPNPVDVNGDGELQRLHDHDDWSNLQLPFPRGSLVGAGSTTDPSEDWVPAVTITGGGPLVLAPGERASVRYVVGNPHGDARTYRLSTTAYGVEVDGLPATVAVPAGGSIGVTLSVTARASKGALELLATPQDGDLSDEGVAVTSVTAPEQAAGEPVPQPGGAGAAGSPTPPVAAPGARCKAPARSVRVRWAKRSGGRMTLRLGVAPARGGRAAAVTLEHGCRVVARGTLRGGVVTLRPVKRGPRLRGVFALRWRGGAVWLTVR